MGIYTPKSAQVTFLWGKNDVRMAIQQFYTPQKTFIPPQNKFLATPLPGAGTIVPFLSSAPSMLSWKSSVVKVIDFTWQTQHASNLGLTGGVCVVVFPFFFFIFKHSPAPNRSWKITHGGPGKSWKSPGFFVGKKVGPLYNAVCLYCE